MYWKLLCLFGLIFYMLPFLGCSEDAADEPDKMTDAANPSFQLAPNFTLLSTELEEVSLTDYQGKVLIVDFWATWCKPCKEEIPRFIELYDEYQAQGFEVVGISTDDVEGRLKNIEIFFQELSKEGFDINYPILLADSDTIQRYQVPVLPSAYLINRNGEIVKVFDGAQESKETYESELKKWL